MLLTAWTPLQNLPLARGMMAFTLGLHIVLACLGIGLPLLLALAEARHLRTGDPSWGLLAQRGAKAFAVLFVVGAVSGTVLSFELGLLWPGLMERFGAVIGLPFTLEGFAFFIEAIFVGLYLYGADRLGPRGRLWTVLPIALAGAASAVFVVSANAWMNTPTGFSLDDSGQAIAIDPLAAMLSPAMPHQVLHMLLGAYLVTGGLVTSAAALFLLRRGGSVAPVGAKRWLSLGLWMLTIAAPLQALSGHWAGERVAATQPLKLAALEAHWETEPRAGLLVFGWPDEAQERNRLAVEVPGLLSLLAFRDVNAEVQGLKDFPSEDRPPVALVHAAFQLMVGLGSLLLLFAAWAHWQRRSNRSWPQGRWFLRAAALTGPAAVLALEAGWVATEVGRQPWIVQGVMRTREAVTDAGPIGPLFLGMVALYALMVFGAVTILLHMLRQALAGTAASKLEGAAKAPTTSGIP